MANGTAHQGILFPVRLLAGGIVGFGLCALVLVSLGSDTDSPVNERSEPMMADQSDNTGMATDDGQWPPAFGTLEVADATPDDSAPIAPDPDWSLRGMVVDGTDGWAIIAGDDGDVMVSVGSEPAPGQRVVAITVAGVEIATGDTSTLVAFDDGPTLAPSGNVPDNVDPDRPPRVLTAALPLEEIRDVGLQRMMGLAGGAQIVELSDGRRAQEIIWVRNGRLYDRIGLRPGDIILSINDIPAGNADALAQAVPSLVRERSFVLAVLRENEQLNLEISVE